MYNYAYITWKIHFIYSIARVDCSYGYEYDKQWYESTAVSQENWVCDKELYKTNTFAFSRVGEVLGTFVFGQLGDT